MRVRDFEAEPDSAQAVRRFVREALHQDAPRLDDIALAASELATNVIRHTDTEYTVRLDLDDKGVRLEVCDGSSIIPAIDDLADSKRGLRIIEGTSDRWGIDLTPGGKKIWDEFSNI